MGLEKTDPEVQCYFKWFRSGSGHIGRDNFVYMFPTDGRQGYNITSSLIGWAHTQNNPCIGVRLKIAAIFADIILNCILFIENFHIFSCDQAALQMVFSVRPSVCLSVCPFVRLSVCPSHLFDYVPIIVSSWYFQELLPVTEVTSMQKVKVRGQRSRSQRSQPNFTVSGL